MRDEFIRHAINCASDIWFVSGVTAYTLRFDSSWSASAYMYWMNEDDGLFDSEEIVIGLLLCAEAVRTGDLS